MSEQDLTPQEIDAITDAWKSNPEYVEKLLKNPEFARKQLEKYKIITVSPEPEEEEDIPPDTVSKKTAKQKKPNLRLEKGDLLIDLKNFGAGEGILKLTTDKADGRLDGGLEMPEGFALFDAQLSDKALQLQITIDGLNEQDMKILQKLGVHGDGGSSDSFAWSVTHGRHKPSSTQTKKQGLFSKLISLAKHKRKL